MRPTTPRPPRRYTVDEVLAFPVDGNRYELVDGDLLVNPAPANRHQWIVQALTYALMRHLDAFGLALAVRNTAADISWEPKQLLQPDVFVMHPSEMRNEWRDVKTLLLAAEVISPSTALVDRNRKRPVYQRHGVQTFWLVDPELRAVEVWHPDDTTPRIVTDVLTWQHAPDTPPVRIRLADVFP